MQDVSVSEMGEHVEDIRILWVCAGMRGSGYATYHVHATTRACDQVTTCNVSAACLVPYPGSGHVLTPSLAMPFYASLT
jgi:hypothetical protein